MRYEYKTYWTRAELASDDRGEAGIVYDVRQINSQDLAVRIKNACNELDEMGFEVISVMPVTRGHWGTHDYSPTSPGSSGREYAGYGFSLTEGAVITARKPRE